MAGVRVVITTDPPYQGDVLASTNGAMVLRVAFVDPDAAVPVAPTTAAFVLTPRPSGAAVANFTLASAQVVNEAVGVYRVTVPITSAGAYAFTVSSTFAALPNETPFGERLVNAMLQV